MSDLDYHVKGSSLIWKVDYIDERFGDAAATELEQRLATAVELPLLASRWYDFELYEALLCFLCDRFLGGRLDELVAVGRYSARVALQGVYRVYCQDRDFSGFLDRVASLHNNFYDRGEMKVNKGSDERSCSIQLHGAPAYSVADAAVAAGFYAGAAELLGNRLDYLDYHVGSNEALFQMRWRPDV